MLGKIFEQFVTMAPICVMARGVLERVLPAEKVDELFEQVAERQYTRDLLFSTVLGLMCQVVCGSRKTIHAAYQASLDTIGVSAKAIYDKLNGVEPVTSASLVRYSAESLQPIIEDMGGGLPALLPGYQVRILDGNCIQATEHRIRELRQTAAGALPGKALVVFAPDLKLVLDVFPCEDGHAQERSLLNDVLPSVKPRDCWVEDRNFCTLNFLLGVAERSAYFVARQHGNLPWEAEGRMKRIGRTEGGTVYEQPIRIQDDQGRELRLRRIQVHLDEATRDGDQDVFILTNLPKKVDAIKVAELYRKRWTIESSFQELAEHLNSEINTLGYPRAALFAFCTALLAYNVMAVIKGALRAEHGAEKIEEELSGYYVADEIEGTHRGMMIAIPEEHWSVFQTMTNRQFVRVLLALARNVDLAKYKKHHRGPKKAQPKRTYHKGKPHVSTFRLIAARSAT